MTMKAKMAVSIFLAVIMIMLLCGNTAYALTTRQTIRLRVRVVGVLSLNLENELLEKNLLEPEAEAFSELKEHGVSVEKLQRNNSMVWLFTKTK